VEQLKAGSVDAITTDEAILAGYVALEPDALKIAGEPFSEERYGVGIAKGDTVLKDHINQLFTDGNDVWTALFEEHLAPAGIEGEQPEVDQ
jgi:glutamate transport system substrate-binding protein